MRWLVFLALLPILFVPTPASATAVCVEPGAGTGDVPTCVGEVDVGSCSAVGTWPDQQTDKTVGIGTCAYPTAIVALCVLTPVDEGDVPTCIGPRVGPPGGDYCTAVSAWPSADINNNNGVSVCTVPGPGMGLCVQSMNDVSGMCQNAGVYCASDGIPADCSSGSPCAYVTTATGYEYQCAIVNAESGSVCSEGDALAAAPDACIRAYQEPPRTCVDAWSTLVDPQPVCVRIE